MGRAETPRASRKSKARAKDEKSNKFWQVIQKGKTLVLRWGRIGDKSQEQTKQLESEDVARAQAKKLIDEKQRKGYVVAASSPSSRSSVDDDVLSTLSACAPLARNDWTIVDVDTFELTLVPLAHAAQLKAISKFTRDTAATAAGLSGVTA